jgi:CheY-like chemotaxis protein
VIAVTGYAAALDRMRCLMAGFSDHLSKPIEVGALEAALARILPQNARPSAPASDAARVEATARRLAQARPGDARFGPTLLETFAMRSGQLIEEITRAHDAGDAAALAQSLKALTTSAEFMGASGLATLCESLRNAVAGGESAGKSAGKSARTVQLVQSLADEHQSVLTVLLRAARNIAGTSR